MLFGFLWEKYVVHGEKMSFMGLLLLVGIVIFIIEANIRNESDRMFASSYCDWIQNFGHK